MCETEEGLGDKAESVKKVIKLLKLRSNQSGNCNSNGDNDCCMTKHFFGGVPRVRHKLR